jgi:hypothetical protein
VHLESRAVAGQALGHAQDGRDADAAGQQQAALRGHQREAVARRADADQLALGPFVVHGNGAATRLRVAQHADLVAVGFGDVPPQRSLSIFRSGICRVDHPLEAAGSRLRTAALAASLTQAA